MSLPNSSVESTKKNIHDEPPPRIIKIHGATRDTVRKIADKYELDYEILPNPRICSTRRQPTVSSERSRSSPATTSSTSPTSSDGYYRSSRDHYYYYYYDDEDWLCWCWLCLPSNRHRYRSYGYDRDAYQRSREDSCSCGTSETSGDCDSESDDLAAVVSIILLVVLIGVIMLFLPEIIAFSLFAIGLVEAAVILVFDVLTLGFFHDELSQTRIAVFEASEEQMKAFYRDLAEKKALPNIPGLYTSGFMWLRVGAFFLVPSLLALALAYFLEAQNKMWYRIPAILAIFSLACIIFGYVAILRKSASVRKISDLRIWW